MQTLLHKAQHSIVNKQPFVLYVKPDETILNGWFQKSTDLIAFKEQEGFVFAGFNAANSIVFPLTDSDVFKEEFDFETPINPLQNEITTDEKAQNEFQNLVEQAVAEIQKGTFEKVVLSRKIEINQDVDLIQSYQSIVKKYPTAFRYLWFHPEVGLWMGATPEQLVKIKAKKLETVALAGTQVYAAGIQWQEKERVEQQLVTDYIQNSVEKLVQALHVSEPFTHQAGHLAHLKTNITGVLLPNVSDLDVISALHPTSAICGMPLKAAQDFINTNEGYDRKYYAGYLGEFKIQNQTNLFVNLRCCEIVNCTINLNNQYTVSIYVGCGITKDSEADKEFIETENKAKTILDSLAIRR